MNQKIQWVFGIVILFTTAVCVSASPDQQTVSGPNPQPTDTRVTSNDDKQAGRPALPQRNPRYLLSTSDVIQITFPITPEFDQLVTVQPDGYISLRGVGDLHVAGKSTPELIQSLKTAYGRFLHDPIINLELKDFQKPFFIAGGELGRPGKYDLRGDTTLTQAVAIAGGFTDKAKHSQVLLLRYASDGWVEVKKYDVKMMLAKRDFSEDVHLRPGDMLYVPKNSLSKIKPFLPIPTLGLTPLIH